MVPADPGGEQPNLFRAASEPPGSADGPQENPWGSATSNSAQPVRLDGFGGAHVTQAVADEYGMTREQVEAICRTARAA